ncbi:hypothetical protein GO755_00350 [Spirosoma sp. HMF4905]|uniref:SnoaL-like domain-containing protein n=1 Tax=Spirosoma arboris TaxID=2682092 RepID=A0A7K1S3R4_9BACT|nr:nuclear transport factor 2 family protein [Spirosoma arboris]MVM28461.1 hypothetical protein [Spirosoma arboris]
MKVSLLSLFLSVATLIVFTTRSFAQTSGDEAAIRQVLDGMQLAFDKRNIKAFGSLFVQSPNLYYQVAPGGGEMIVAHGYDNMVKMIGHRLKELANEPPTKNTFTQYKTHINGNSAWVTFTLIAELPGGQKVNACQFSVLEKKADNGSAPRWKIAAMTWQDYPDGKLVEVK